MALAERRCNVTNCTNGWDGCDRAKLNQGEAGEVDVAVRKRNMSDCKVGRDNCDYSLLSRSEAFTLAAAEHAQLDGMSEPPRLLRSLPADAGRSGRDPAGTQDASVGFSC